MCRESFFANCRVRGGYSGVATFCRAASCVPVAALDGFTGACMLRLSNRSTCPLHCLAIISQVLALSAQGTAAVSHALSGRHEQCRAFVLGAMVTRSAVLNQQQALRLSGKTALCRPPVAEPGQAEGSASVHSRAGGALQSML